VTRRILIRKAAESLVRQRDKVPAWRSDFHFASAVKCCRGASFSIRRTSVDDQQTSTLEDRQKLTIQVKVGNTISPEK
jgi:hypothetical protein